MFLEPYGALFTLLKGQNWKKAGTFLFMGSPHLLAPLVKSNKQNLKKSFFSGHPSADINLYLWTTHWIWWNTECRVNYCAMHCILCHDALNLKQCSAVMTIVQQVYLCWPCLQAVQTFIWLHFLYPFYILLMYNLAFILLTANVLYVLLQCNLVWVVFTGS